ncbi:MAG: sugar transferase [Bacteroidota bacterium]
MVEHSYNLDYTFPQKSPCIKIPVAYLRFRRVVEIFFILLLLPVLLPITLIIGLAIKIDSKGRVFFLQQRPGKDGQLFHLVKFRTMIDQPQAVLTLTQKNDVRITTFGSVLRRLHLDELPQVWNVLRGDMSIIGPRPVPAALYEYYLKHIPNYEQRHFIRPGITGWAQVEIGYTNDLAGEQRKWQLDIFYLQHISPKYDWQILWRTFIRLR